MAIITSTTANISLTSTYTCTTVRLLGVDSSGNQVDQVVSSSTSYPTKDSETITFTYDTIDLSTVNMVVIQMKGTNTLFGGSVHVNDEYASSVQGVYTAYLEPSTLTATSASYVVDFTTLTPHHNHYNDADSETILSGGTNHSRIQYIKHHSALLTLSEITLKIYTGEDVIARPAVAQMFVGVDNVAKKIANMFVGVNNKAKPIASAWIGVNGKAKKIFPTFTLGMLSPGDVVKIDEMGDGNLVEWIVMHQNYYGEDQTVLMRKYLLDAGAQRLNYEGGSGSSYSNPYFGKTVDNYLTNNWLLSTGYLTFQKMVLETTISVKYWSGGTVQSEARKVWLPSAVNISPSSFSSQQDDDPVGGFDYFITNDNNTARKAYLASDLTAAKYWWTRSTTGGTHPHCKAVGDSGSLRNDPYYNGRYLRPVINVSANNFIRIDMDGSYILLYNG